MTKEIYEDLFNTEQFNERYYLEKIKKPLAITSGIFNIKFLVILFLIERFSFLVLLLLTSNNIYLILDPIALLFWLIMFIGVISFKPNIKSIVDVIGVDYFGGNLILPKENLKKEVKPANNENNFKCILYEEIDLYIEKDGKLDYLINTRKYFANNFMNFYFHLIAGLLILIGIPFLYYLNDTGFFVIDYVIPVLNIPLQIEEISIELYGIQGEFNWFFILRTAPFIAYFMIIVGSLLLLFFEYIIFLWMFGEKLIKKIEDDQHYNKVFLHIEFPLIKKSLAPFAEVVQSVVIRSLAPLAVLLITISAGLFIDPLNLGEIGKKAGLVTIIGGGIFILILYPIVYFFPLLTNRRILNKIKKKQIEELQEYYWKNQYQYFNELKKGERREKLEELTKDIEQLKYLIKEIEKISVWPYNVNELRAFTTTLGITAISAIISILQLMLN